MWKPHWWSAFLGTQKTGRFFIVFFLLKWWINVNFRGSGGGKKKETAQVTGPSYLGVTLSSGKLALSLLYFPKGIQSHNLIDISPSETSLGIQVHPLWTFTNEMASPNSKPLPLLSVLLVCALLAVKAGTDIPSEWVQACFSHCLCWRPFPLLRFTLKKGLQASMWSWVPSKPLVTTLAASLQTANQATRDTKTLARLEDSKSRRNHNTPETPRRTMTSAGGEQTDRQSRQTLTRPRSVFDATQMFSIKSSLPHKHSYMRLWNPHT